jgi:superoxide dismutase, Fe-Mn family
MYTEQTFNIPPLQGMSERSIEEHKKLYAGYVKHANLILDHIAELSKDSEKHAYELAELQRRFSFEFCGMRNHEVYFKLLEGSSTDAPTLIAQIESQWGSLDAWKARFQAIALTRGIGWAMLYWDPSKNELIHAWVDEQHLGQLTGCTPIIALDMWEHSFVADYQPSGKKQYIVDFLNQMNWAFAEATFQSQKRAQ